MKNNLLSWLLSTGLDEQRASLYLTALTKGESTASELAKTMSLGRTAVYDNLRVLQKRGYMNVIQNGKRHVFIPIHPKELYKKFDSQRQQLKDLLPDFLALYSESGSQPFVQLFQGPYAAREVYEDIFTTTKSGYSYFSPPQLTLQVIDRSYIEQWVKKRVTKGITSRSLRVKAQNIVGEPVFNKESEYLRQIRYLPSYVDLKASIYIYEKNIGVISTIKEGTAFIIHSADLSFSLLQIFNFLWSISKDS
ncbi:hypothetical protein HYW94_03040 [Candidatus Uhrbacteria bacterium]|nr:hypothetical protein [Candidatus Uhrbacteria bacterium]